MNSLSNSLSDSFDFFAEKDMGAALTEYMSWKDSALEGQKDYAERIRKIKLLKTIKEIALNELTENQKAVMKMKYEKGLKQEEIAEILKVSPSCITRSIKRSQEVISEKMKYVFFFADCEDNLYEPPVDIGKACAAMLFNSAKPNKLGERLFKVRFRKSLSAEVASFGAGITPKRLAQIENGSEMKISEFVKLIFFYGVGADEMIFGV